MSGVTFVSVPGMVAAGGFSYLQMALGFVVGQFVIAFVLIPLFYRMNLTSIYEYLENRFGLSSYKTGAWFFFISKILGASVRFYLTCAVLQLLVFDPFGLPFILSVAVSVAVTWLYTVKGGVKSLIWTDSFKTLCLVLSAGLSIYLISKGLGFNFSETTSAICNSDYSRVFFFDDLNDRRFFFKQFFAGIFTVIAATGLDQDMMQKNMSCRNYRDSQKNIVTSGVLQFFVIALFLILGVLLYMFAEANELPLPAKSDQVFPFIATQAGLPVVAGLLFVVGLVSASYAAAGSALTALTTSFTVDILGRAKGKNEAQIFTARKNVHAGMAIVMGVVIIIINRLNNTSVIDAVYVLASYTYGPILGMFTFGIFTKRVVHDKAVPFVALISPLISLIIDKNSQAWFNGYRFSYEILIMNALFVLIGLTLFSKRNE